MVTWIKNMILSGLFCIGLTTSIAVYLNKNTTWGLVNVIWINLMIGFVIFMNLQEREIKNNGR